MKLMKYDTYVPRYISMVVEKRRSSTNLLGLDGLNKTLAALIEVQANCDHVHNILCLVSCGGGSAPTK